MQDSQYIDLGKYLKDVRESLNLSVEQIAADLNIRARYLIAIEEHNLGELPSGVYLLGYVKN
ncbi:MAG: helix-turn-helix domain-containing protein, partial [Pseudomonadota bacterium]